MPASASRVHAWKVSGRAFVGMDEVQAHPQGMMLAQHAAQLARDALGQHGGHFRPHADELHVRDGPQLPEQPIQPLFAEQERVAAGQEHVADGRRAADVVHARSKRSMLGMISPWPTTRERVQ